MEYPYTNQLLYIKRNVINVLLRNSNSEPFKVPVNPELLHIPQYPKLIKCPMDFGTIKMKLDKQIYQTANECKSDFLDVFRNCYIFNEPGSLYVEMALKLENLFKRKMADLPVPEHYAPDSAFHTPKSNKVKKGKSLKLSTPLTVKPKLPPNLGVPPSQAIKSDISVNQKRNRSESNNDFMKEEPSIKKPKIGIDFKMCKHVILNLVSKKYNDLNRYFLEPVDVEGLKLHDYYDIVKKPMDLGTVKRKLLENCYQSNEEFAEDIKLIFKNCYLYNPEGHEVHRCGKLLEGIFLKLYQSAFLNSAKSMTKSIRAQNNYDDLQPLLQKILKRQTEIDLLHVDIIKRNREIRQSIDLINGTELIKSFKASVNLNHKPAANVLMKKPSNNSINHDQKFEKQLSPKPALVKPEVKNETIISKVSSNSAISSSKPPEMPTSPNPIPFKPEPVKETSRFSETKRTIKPTFKSDVNNSEETPKTYNQKRPLNNVNNHLPPENIGNSSEVPKPPPKPPVQLETPKPADVKKPAKNSDEFNNHLKEIKAWIGMSSTELASKIREFINKSENKNVVSVNLLKLKPATINGLYKMMTEPVKEIQKVNNEVKSNLKEFTIEDRLQLSQDLRLLGEKCSEKILHIYKKTEDVQSSDGECEIDFQTMKLITLHSLREFADKCLQKKRDRQLKKGAVTAGQPVGISGGDSDSDSSDSSDSDASDSNSDASTSSSDNDFFNNLPKTANTIDTSQSSIPSNLLSKTNQDMSKPVHEFLPNNDISQSTMGSEKHLVDSTQEESRLTDSSDSDKDDDDDDEDDGKVNSTPKRPIYSVLWNKSSSSDNKKPVNAPAIKQNSLSIPHPMYNNSARNQLNESLRQIVQDAQAHENVKKQEEELRLVRIKEEEEHKKQQMLKLQALNESRKQLHYSENLKKEEDMVRLKELSFSDRKQRLLDIPCIPEREDYHQILCDFEYNIDQDLIMKLVNLDQKQVHL